MKINYKTTITISIIIAGILLRVYYLTTNPIGFFADEASIGYNAYTILTKGTDEHGVKYPLFFQAFGEYKSPVQIYSTVPLIGIFGLNEFPVRATSAIYGTLSIVSLFLLVKELCLYRRYRTQTALLSAFFLGISPWHIHLSRVAMEAMMPFVFFTTLGVYFLLKYIHCPSFKSIIMTVIFLCLGTYSYFPARIFIPLYGAVLFVIYFSKIIKIKSHLFAAFIVGIIFLIPFIRFMLTPNGWARFQQVSIFKNPPAEESVLKHIYNNYLSHFSYDFLFLKGDAGISSNIRHSLRNFGELYLFQLPLLLLGSIYLFAKKEFRNFFLLGFWLLLYPTGSMLTTDSKALATRSIIGVIPFQIIMAFGLIFLIAIIDKILSLIPIKGRLLGLSILYFTITAIISFSFYKYLYLYYKDYPLYSSDYWGWQYGFRPTMDIFKKEENNYDNLKITHRFNMGEGLLKFYNVTYQCAKCSVMSNPITINQAKRELFALRKDDIEEAKELYPDLLFYQRKVIYLPDNTPEIFIGEFSQSPRQSTREI